MFGQCLFQVAVLYCFSLLFLVTVLYNLGMDTPSKISVQVCDPFRVTTCPGMATWGTLVIRVSMFVISWGIVEIRVSLFVHFFLALCFAFW